MKKMNIIAAFCLLFFLTCIETAAKATGISIDKQGTYNKAIILVEQKEYTKALDEFLKIPDYKDSASWNYYCKGMIEIESANQLETDGYIDEAKPHIEKAAQYFLLLSQTEFEDSKKLSLYCSARQYELQRLHQKALDIYSTLLGVLDSDARYLRISNKEYLPTQAPKAIQPEMLDAIPAVFTKKIQTYWGPGSNYSKQDVLPINAEMEIYICGRENNYFLVEAKWENAKVRFWAPTLRINRSIDKQEQQVGVNPQYMYLTTDAVSYWGPGKDYLETGIIIDKGCRVTAYEAEGEYTMIEYSSVDNKSLMRMWVQTSFLGK